VVDERRVRRLLLHMEESTVALEQLATADRAELGSDPVRLAGLKYFLVVSIEGCLQVSHHLCVSEGWGAPTDNADAVDRLGRHGALAADTAKRLRLAVGLRNVLVHQYVDVDDDRVLASLDDVGDLRAFVNQVATWLDRQRSN
jgi:uncharacterized protein YutE (UPF0331/DUF86 family)